jgi:hypothetical protein
MGNCGWTLARPRAIDKPVARKSSGDSCKRVSQPHHAEDHAADTLAMTVAAVMSSRALASI